MIPAGDDGDGLVVDGVYQSVGVIDAARAEAGEVFF